MKSTYGFGNDKFLSYAIVYHNKDEGDPRLRGPYRWAEFRAEEDAARYLNSKKKSQYYPYMKIIRITRRAKRP